MRITIAHPEDHWMAPFGAQLEQQLRAAGFSATVIHAADDATGGDICFWLSWPHRVGAAERARYGHNIVVHASNLPAGRGWSPWVYRIWEGHNIIHLCLIEIVEDFDAGPVYLRSEVKLSGNELLDEIHARLGAEISALCSAYAANAGTLRPVEQVGEPSYYRRLTPADSELDVDQPLRTLFNKLRTADNERYPAFFRLGGCTYELVIRKQKAKTDP